MRVLIADDDRLFCSLLTSMVEECGHDVVSAVSSGGLAVLKSFSELVPETVLLDVFMPRCNGLTVCHALLSRRPETKVVFMSGMVESEHPYVVGCKARGFLKKPMLMDQLRSMLDSLEAPTILPVQAEMPSYAAMAA